MKKQEKKQLIIEAAAKVLAEKGYEKASIKDIAAEAKITPGLIHYYFRNKEEILTELLMEASLQYTSDMQNLMQTVPSEQLSKAALREPIKRVLHQPDWYRLRYELFAIGLRNPNLTERVNDILENGRNGIADILHAVSPETAGHQETASILLACFDGLALQKLMNPDFDLEKAYEVLEKMAMSLKDTR
ncbi:TetR/AcrR family transcriptional regulator [Brevibacillus ruminantium]|uniref:TetR/AcrR family transcriptional regulator n=1 Tax=Brevibacillus ruminantium TaxID=2950604 RepID=A0ABY4W8E6_9BACL|nr:TetR/AcrR family transcriptional regulator [Brevibacillus ruminantium]USG63333.1 TetR/AcrR family transcriptional regulator [Brevibacillus ruminantium]